MQIKVNSNWLEVEQGNHLHALLESLLLHQKSGMAVAVNATVIPKKDWQQFELRENDEIIIIEAAQGG